MSSNLPPSPPRSTSSSPVKINHLEKSILYVSASKQLNAENLALKMASLTLNPPSPEKTPRSSPTRRRKCSSISMSEIPAHMSAGQILPSGGLELASEGASAQMMSCLDDGGGDSDSDSDSSDDEEEEEDTVPLFSHEMLGRGGVFIAGRPSMDEAWMAETAAVFEDDEKVAADELLDGESDEDIAGGGVLIADGGVYTATDFMKQAAQAEKRAAAELKGQYTKFKTLSDGNVAAAPRGDPFPEYDDVVAMELLKAGPKTYPFTVRCAAVAEPEYVVVDRPIGAVSRRVSIGGSA